MAWGTYYCVLCGRFVTKREHDCDRRAEKVK